jgi:hypothetical protein
VKHHDKYSKFHELSIDFTKAIQCFCVMNFESKLSVHATQTLHKQNPVLFDLDNAFCSKNQCVYSNCSANEKS